MTTATNVDVLTNVRHAKEWVQKIHLENRMDRNLQRPAPGESNKVEIPSIDVEKGGDQLARNEVTTQQQTDSSPSSPAITNDSYLNAIVSSANRQPPISSGCTGAPDCVCYRCQRLRRRAKNTPSTEHENTERVTDESKQTRQVSITRSQGSLCRRKTPTVKSYDKHLPRPTYSEDDSIYRVKDQKQPATEAAQTQEQKPPSLSDMVVANDNYEISWKDETTGDNILDSLKTFQTIFAEQPEDCPAGLSDLIETRAKELKEKRAEEAANRKEKADGNPLDDLVKQAGCFTLSSRHGPPHNALTLFHTMKLGDSVARRAAYGTAFEHCIRANSGLAQWIHKRSSRGIPTAMQNYTPRHSKKPVKKSSILPPILSGKRSKSDDLWTKFAEGQAPSLPPNRIRSSDEEDFHNTDVTPTDVLSAAHALLPNQSPPPMALHDSSHSRPNNSKPYDHIDTPSRPVPNKPAESSSDKRDNGSISSSGDGDSTKTGKSSKLFASIGKRSMRSLNGTIKSTDEKKNEGQMALQEVAARMAAAAAATAEAGQSTELEKLCEIMPHADPEILKQYLKDAGSDHMKALALCKRAVVAGDL